MGVERRKVFWYACGAVTALFVLFILFIVVDSRYPRGDKPLLSGLYTDIGLPFSLFRGDISIVGGQEAQAAFRERGILVLAARKDNPIGITITGWKLVFGEEKFEIGEGAPLPRFGAVNTTSPITLGPTDTAVLSLHEPPTGYSFRVNRCSGYFEQFQDFDPPLAKRCPRPNRAPLDPVCAPYLDRLPVCETILTAPEGIPLRCTDPLRVASSYEGCVKEHSADYDFYTGEWRIFLGKSTAAESAGRVDLFDSGGALVDTLYLGI